MAKECEWKHSAGYEENTWNDSDVWFTACDNAFEFNEGGPKENHFKYCCYCGGELIQKGE